MKILARVLLGVVALVALIAGATLTLLDTRWGGERALRLALPRINAAIAGEMTARGLRLHGHRLILEQVALRDPDGELVARVARVEVDLSPLALLRRRLEIDAVTIDQPALFLVADADGTNLARALRARHPAPEPATPAAATPSRPGGIDVDLRTLLVSDAAIDFRSVVPGGARHARISDLDLRGHARYQAARAAIDAGIEADFDGGHLRARAARSPAEGARLQIDTLRLPAGLLRALEPALALEGAVMAHGEVVQRGDIVNASVQIDGGGGSIDARGTIDVVTLRAQGAGLTVHARGIDLSRVLRDAPASSLGVELHVDGGGRSLDTLDGALRLTVLPSRLGGHALGPITLTAKAAGGRYEVADLRAALPGVAVTGHGTATRRDVDVHLRVEAADLGAVARSLAPPRRPPPVALAGRGRLDVALTGSLRAPALRVAGRFASLGVGESRASGLTLSAAVPDLRHLEAADLDLAAPELFVGGQSLRGVRVTLRATTPRLALTARTTAPYPLSIAATGRRQTPRRWTLDRLALQYPEATWALARPARVEIGDEGRFAIEGLRLRAGPQTIEADVVRAARGSSARLAISALDLGRLPRALVPPTLALTGRLDVDARVGETKVAVAATARGLAVARQEIGDVDLSIAAEGDRASQARLEVSSRGAQAVFTAKTPLSLRRILRRPPTAGDLTRTPVELTGDVDRLPLAALAPLARYRSPVAGLLSSHLALTGTALDPRGTLTLDISGAAAALFPATDARVELELGPHAIDARVRVTRKQHPLLALIARVGAGVPALRDPARLVDAPLSLRAVVGPLAVQRLGLAALSDRDPPRELKGQLHADLAVDGSLRAPRALMHVNASDLRLDKALVGAAQVELRYADRATKIDARLTTPNGGTLRAQAATQADLGYPGVTHFDARHLPLDARLDADRFDLQGLSGATQGLRTVGGLLAAAATVRGTIADPRVSGRIELTDGVVALTGFGDYRKIHLVVHGDEQKLALDELSLSSGGGRANVSGTAAHLTGRGYDVAARAYLKGFPIYQEGQPLASASATADIKGTLSPFATQASIDVHDARIELSDAKRKSLQGLAPPGDVVLVDDGKPLNRAQADRLRAILAQRRTNDAAAAVAGGGARDSGGAGADARAPAPTRATSTVRIVVNAPRKVWVTGKDAYLELGLAPGFAVSMADETRVYGQVVVHRGRIDLFGRRFDLKTDSTLQFDGPPDRPELDVSAQYQNLAENVTVLWTATGPLDHLKVSVSSPNRPDLTESQLYTLVITGHLNLGGGTSGSASPSAAAASFLGSALAARLQKTLAKKLPLDVLTIDAGGEAESLSGTQLEAGRYVTDNLYVGYVGRVGADPTRYQNANAVHVEYQISSRWAVDGEYGDAGTGSLDLMWKKSD